MSKLTHARLDDISGSLKYWVILCNVPRPSLPEVEEHGLMSPSKCVVTRVKSSTAGTPKYPSPVLV